MPPHLSLSIGIHVLNELCETASMEQRKSQNEVLDELVARGTITEEQACEIADAPQWSFSFRELMTYLASLIIAVGVIRLLAVAFDDASEGVIVTALYVTSAAAGFASWKFSTKSELFQRFGEVLELGSLGAAIGATAVLLSNTDLKGESIASLLCAVGLAWGAYRCRETGFAGTVAMSVGANGLAIALGALINSDKAWPAGILMLMSGSGLVYLGTTRIGAPFVARASGALFIFIGSMTLGGELSYGRPIPIVTGIALFIVGSVLLAPEVLLVGAVCTVVGVVMTVMRWISNDMAQGLVIIATGVVTLIVLSIQMKRISSQQEPGARVA